ncbi:hypothetical protein [Natrinema gelatinilyticum]|uniref:hypothetical protein n=1 Tax=Natrinema gelatinilyticum TaxID=2961571 RepID=UPI0020C3D1C0|nr:hypothetical protein [Natrinema gelatinilyticum]
MAFSGTDFCCERSAKPRSHALDDAVEHDVQDVTIAVETVTDGLYVEHDGCATPAAERDRIFDMTYFTSRDGTVPA